MSESKLYNSFKKNWKNYLRRIESSSVGKGIPDCHLVNEKQNDIFLEFKFLPKKFIEKKLPIKKSQIIWFLEYKGKFAFMLFEIDKTYYLFDKTKIFTISQKISWLSFEAQAIIKSKNVQTVTNYINLA